MNFKKSIFFVLIFIFLVFLLIFLNKNQDSSKNSQVNSIQYVKIAGATVKVDLALTREARERGLSGKSELAEDEGMLFVFDHADKYSFWMKDMNFPIDIVWIGEDLRVNYIKKDVSPSSYPEAFPPTLNSLYVLEVVGGFSEKNNLNAGDKVKFLP